MNSDEVEAAVAAYLAAGADGDVAGQCGAGWECPVSRAGKTFARTGTSSVLLNQRDARREYIEVRHTPTVRRFVALVDAEPGPTVTFAVARRLWEQAKGAG